MKRMIWILCLLLLQDSVTVMAQMIVLDGQVSILNSGYRTGTIEYVSNAVVTASFAAPASTDVAGRFALAFVAKDSGVSVGIAVEKAGLEVVNGRELQDVVVGRQLPLRVYLADSAELARVQAELYDVSIRALTAEKDALVARLGGFSGESGYACGVGRAV